MIKYSAMALILFVVATLSIRNIAFTGPSLEPTGLPESPIIDIHAHVAGLGYGDSGCFVSDEMSNSYKFDYYLQAFGITRDNLKMAGDQLIIQRVAALVKQSDHVDGVVILAMDGVIDGNGNLDKEKTQVYIPNDYIAEQTALYSALYFGASINPYRYDALQRLEKVKQQGAKLIKWIPNIQHIDPADTRLIPFYQKMKALNLPLLSHAGQERSFHSAIDEYGDPTRLELPLSIGVTVIAGHIATTGESNNQSNYQRILQLFEHYPNLYADISSLTQVNKLGYLDKALQDPRLKGRLIYGSDYPLVNMALVSPYYFPLQLPIKKIDDITKIINPWDRDIMLKQALGVSTEIFAASAKLLPLAP